MVGRRNQMQTRQYAENLVYFRWRSKARKKSKREVNNKQKSKPRIRMQKVQKGQAGIKNQKQIVTKQVDGQTDKEQAQS